MTLTINTLLEAKAKMDAFLSADEGRRVPYPMEIIESVLFTLGPFEDWSQCRSPSRAKRRRVMGHPQRIRQFIKPDPNLHVIDGKVYGHPVAVNALRRAIPERLKVDYERNFWAAYGRGV